MKKTIELSFLLTFIGVCGNADASFLDKAKAAMSKGSTLFTKVSNSSLGQSETAKTAFSLGKVAVNAYGQDAVAYALTPVVQKIKENVQTLQQTIKEKLANSQNSSTEDRANSESAIADLQNAQTALNNENLSSQQKASLAECFIQQAKAKLQGTSYKEWIETISNTSNAVAAGDVQRAITAADNMAASMLTSTAASYGVVSPQQQAQISVN
jgi:hypothetical protein